jgi:Domain of unknown function (DUF1905)
VVLDLGDGRYAFYAHLEPGSESVEAGERVERGEPIGPPGSSGSSSGRIYFRIMDSRSPASSDGLPFVFDGFALTGSGPPLDDALMEAVCAGEPVPVDPAGPARAVGSCHWGRRRRLPSRLTGSGCTAGSGDPPSRDAIQGRRGDTGLVELVFTGQLIEWRGPSPYYFVPVPDEEAADIREVAAMATYGWGVIPVDVRVGDITFSTSLFPKDGGYLMPLKDAVRKPQRLAAGDDVTVEMTVRIES